MTIFFLLILISFIIPSAVHNYCIIKFKNNRENFNHYSFNKEDNPKVTLNVSKSDFIFNEVKKDNLANKNYRDSGKNLQKEYSIFLKDCKINILKSPSKNKLFLKGESLINKYKNSIDSSFKNKVLISFCSQKKTIKEINSSMYSLVIIFSNRKSKAKHKDLLVGKVPVKIIYYNKENLEKHLKEIFYKKILIKKIRKNKVNIKLLDD